METLKMLQDKNRLVIIIEGADEEKMQGMYRTLDAYYHFPAVEPTTADETSAPVVRNPLPALMTVTGLAEAPVTNEDVPDTEKIAQMTPYTPDGYKNTVMTGGDYQGLLPSDALYADNEKALLKLFQYAGHLPEGAERSNIISSCKQYMVTMPTVLAVYDTRDKQIQCLQTLIAMGGLDTIFNGWSSFENFAQVADDNEVQTAFAQALYLFQRRGQQ